MDVKDRQHPLTSAGCIAPEHKWLPQPIMQQIFKFLAGHDVKNAQSVCTWWSHTSFRTWQHQMGRLNGRQMARYLVRGAGGSAEVSTDAKGEAVVVEEKVIQEVHRRPLDWKVLELLEWPLDAWLRFVRDVDPPLEEDAQLSNVHTMHIHLQFTHDMDHNWQPVRPRRIRGQQFVQPIQQVNIHTYDDNKQIYTMVRKLTALCPNVQTLLVHSPSRTHGYAIMDLMFQGWPLLTCVSCRGWIEHDFDFQRLFQAYPRIVDIRFLRVPPLDQYFVNGYNFLTLLQGVPRLQVLHMEDNSAGAEAISALPDNLNHMLGELHVYASRMQISPGFHAITRFRHLHTLSFVTTSGVTSLECLAQIPTLTRLTLRYTHANVVPLVESLINVKNVTDLVLDQCAADPTVHALVAALGKCVQLLSLSVIHIASYRVSPEKFGFFDSDNDVLAALSSCTLLQTLAWQPAPSCPECSVDRFWARIDHPGHCILRRCLTAPPRVDVQSTKNHDA